MDSSKKSSSNKISDIVRLRQILKKWKKAAHASSSSTTTKTAAAASSPIKFIKRTLSFTDISNSNANNVSEGTVPKGYLAVCVGIEEKRYVIPTEYLRHPAFGVLLREAEEEFGFQQQGVLKIPCQVPVFEKILYLVQHNKDVADDDSGRSLFRDFTSNLVLDSSPCCSPHAQLCR